jgi:hypothetical protein
MDVEVVVDGRDRHLVEVHADERLRADQEPVAAVRHAADVELRLARAVGLERQARQVLGVAVEARDLQLLESPGVERHDADRHALQVLGALLCRDDDFLERAGRGCGRRLVRGRRGARREDRRGHEGELIGAPRRARATPPGRLAHGQLLHETGWRFGVRVCGPLLRSHHTHSAAASDALCAA